MKYLLKWMNNCEKELLSSCEPLYNYAQWVRNSANEIAALIRRGFDTGEMEIPELKKELLKLILQDFWHYLHLVQQIQKQLQIMIMN